jgi:hypothetical protein
VHGGAGTAWQIGRVDHPAEIKRHCGPIGFFTAIEPTLAAHHYVAQSCGIHGYVMEKAARVRSRPHLAGSLVPTPGFADVQQNRRSLAPERFDARHFVTART